MPTERERMRTLIAAGLLPETAQDIVEDGQLGSVTDDARIRERDRTRARIFALYSPLIPDHLRGMFDPDVVADVTP